MMQARRIIIIMLITGIAALSIYRGVVWRRELYTATAEIRFTRNVGNAYIWGRYARAAGVFNIYERLQENGVQLPAYFPLDYPPLRLAAVTVWQGWTERHFPGSKQWQPEYEFTAPLLWGNTVAALVSSVLVFLLIRMWAIRMDDATRPADVAPRLLRGAWSGLIGAMLLWFNPAALCDGYIWGQWEIWLAPFFLGAVYLASLDWWFAAGACLAIGACLKGQLLLAAPILILWQLFQWRIGAVLRLLAGLMFAAALIAFPWLKLTPAAFTWYMLMLGAAGLLVPFTVRWRIKPRWLIPVYLGAIAMAWPWTSSVSYALRALPAALLGLIALGRFLPARLLPHLYAASVAAAILLTIPLFQGKTAWFTQGFGFGVDHSPRIHDQATYSMLTVVQTYLAWPNDRTQLIDAPLVGKTELRKLAVGIYVFCLLLCGAGAALHDRRRDTRFLIAVSLPWLLFFLVLPQMQSRYLVFAAVMSSVLFAAGFGLGLLGVIVSIIGGLGVLEDAYRNQGGRPPITQSLPSLQTLQAIDPHIGWMLLMVALILLYHAVAPRKRKVLS